MPVMPCPAATDAAPGSAPGGRRWPLTELLVDLGLDLHPHPGPPGGLDEFAELVDAGLRGVGGRVAVLAQHGQQHGSR